MEQDLFQLVPSEITINILSRLPVRTIAMSKCVCKPWLDLLSTDDFVNSHLSKSVPALVVSMNQVNSRYMWRYMRCTLFEFEEADDDDDDDDDDDVDHRYNPLTNFDFPLQTRLVPVGAADGLFLLRSNCPSRRLYIFNPITREYVELCGDVKDHGSIYGFGVSKITGQHKVVQIFPKPEQSKCDANVYTLETGSWRRFQVEATATSFKYWKPCHVAFVNGNLHWLSEMIDCFDLETECFSMFSAPPLDETACKNSICALKDCLCVCIAMPPEGFHFVIDIWLMKEYGVEKSWTKEYVIGIDMQSNYAVGLCNCFCPIKVFKNGDILISGEYIGCELFHFSGKTHTAHKFGLLQPPRGAYISPWLLTPSLLALKRNLGMENVISF